MDVTKLGNSNNITSYSKPSINSNVKEDKGLSDKNTVSISQLSQHLYNDVEEAITFLKKESLAVYGEADKQQSHLTAYIDTGKYNKYLLDNKLNDLENKYGKSIDRQALEDELIKASGVSIENPLQGSARQDILHDDYTAKWLKEKDVQSLTDIYIYSKENGISEDKVSGLAFYLSMYRADEAKRPVMAYPSSRADSVNTNDIEHAKRIYSSDEAPVTMLDKKFLDNILNPDKNLNGFSEVVGLDFLEKIVGAGDGDDEFLPTLQADITVPEISPRYWSAIGYSPTKSTSSENHAQELMMHWLSDQLDISPDNAKNFASLPSREQSLIMLRTGFYDMVESLIVKGD